MKKHKEMFSIMDRGEKTMYNKRRIIKEMKPARGAAELYTYFAGTDDSVFLDSSLDYKTWKIFCYQVQFHILNL